MRKGITTIALIAALAASQAVISFAAISPGTGPVIGGGDSDYDIGERVDSVLGGGASAGSSTVTGSGQGSNAVGIGVGQAVGETTVTTNSRGQAVVGNTALEFVQGSGGAVSGLPETVVNAINGINSGLPLNQVISDVDLTGYNALVGTHAIVTKDAVTNAEKAGPVEVPLYVPNLVDGLGEVQVLFYNNLTGTWTVIQPSRIDAASKMIWFNIPNSGTLSVIYKR
ncbi:hypothetical protein CBFG_01784 [Clostridiales bacterium 1_7_47FAA]|uniref:Peptidase n=1 Tax=Enterocloster hominis (ex Hitch et al. 2024) TaxID=1917870 RepID=A0ABV1CZG4_9FIRM|nr:hypothetical protein CBFG_01784 [Clostridiales bacterium 1_7_47FAA]